MADPRTIAGVVLSHSGTSPGPASGITYRIACSDPNIQGVFDLNGQVPAARWPDELDTRAVEDMTPVIGVIVANRITWHFQEMPDFAPCGTPANRSEIRDRIFGTVEKLKIVPPGMTDVFTTGSQAGAENTPSGGETSP